MQCDRRRILEKDLDIFVKPPELDTLDQKELVCQALLDLKKGQELFVNGKQFCTFVGDPLKNPFISVAQSDMLISTGGDKISDTNSVPEEIGYNFDEMLDEEFDALVPNGDESVSRECNESASSDESLSSNGSPSGTPLVDDYDSLEGTYSHSVNSLDLRRDLRLKEDGPQEPIRPGDVIETYDPNGFWGR
jgi:hypothetical protein